MRPLAVIASLVLSMPTLAIAQDAPPPLPWLMRPTGATTALRSDTAVGDFDGGTAITTLFQANLKIRPDLAAGVRVAYNLLEVDEGEDGQGVSNPAVFGLWTPRPGWPVQPAFFLAAVMPVGQGAGNDAELGERRAVAAGLQTRQGMDNALFATSYTTGVAGVGVSWTRGPVALVGEATVLQLFRVYELPDGTPDDDVRTNLTSGLHAAWTFWGPLTVSGELHLQRWLYAPELMDADTSGANREQGSWTIGLRGWWKVGDLKLRPGLAYSRGLDDPMGGQAYQIVQLDLPVVF
jgi:hypothetical protein